MAKTPKWERPGVVITVGEAPLPNMTPLPDSKPVKKRKKREDKDGH